MLNKLKHAWKQHNTLGTDIRFLGTDIRFFPTNGIKPLHKNQ